MASQAQLDINVISRNGINCDNKILGITIDDIVSVSKDADDVTQIIFEQDNDNHASLTPVRYKVLETLGDIIVKANAADFDNGLISLPITKVNSTIISPARTEIINRKKIEVMHPTYDDAGAVTGTKIVYNHWRQQILYTSDNLVTNTSSS